MDLKTRNEHQLSSEHYSRRLERASGESGKVRRRSIRKKMKKKKKRRSGGGGKGIKKRLES